MSHLHAYFPYLNASRKLKTTACLATLLATVPVARIYADPAGTESDPIILTSSVYSLTDDGHWYKTGANISVAANNALLGYNTSGTGLTVSAGYTLSTNNIILGYNSGKTGSLKVDGGTLTTAASNGSIEVGGNGTGFLSITNGGTASATYCYIGAGSGTNSAGTLEMSGAGSSLALSSNLIVGYGAGSTGSFTLSDGASVSLTSITVGNGGAGSATISGSGTKLTNHGNMIVGNGETSSFTVSNGAVVENDVSTKEFYLGTLTDAKSKSITITGAGSKMTAAMITYIGYQSTSTMTISDGGVFTTTGSANYVGFLQAANASAVNVTGAGSAWLNTGTLTLGGSSGASGKLTIEGGALVTAKSFTAFTGSTLYLKSGFFALASSDATTNLTALQGYLDGGAVVYAYDPETSQYVLVNSSNASSLVKTKYFSDITSCTALSGYNLSGAYTVLTTGYTDWNAAVPEPSTFAFAGGTAAILATMILRRKKNSR